MKKIKHYVIFPTVAVMLLINSLQANEVKSAVDVLILEHAQMWGDVVLGPSYAERNIRIGVQEQVTDNPAILHAIDVAELLNDATPGGGADLLEACCWRPQPAIYSNFVVGSMQEVLNAGTAPPTPEGLYNPEDRADLFSAPVDFGRASFPIPENFGVHMASVLDQIIKVRDYYTGIILPGGDAMDQHGFEWMSALAQGIFQRVLILAQHQQQNYLRIALHHVWYGIGPTKLRNIVNTVMEH